MTTLIVGPFPTVDRVVARLLGRNAMALATLTAKADEAMLARFPPSAWCESQEANLFVLERLKDTRWRRAVDGIAAAEEVPPEVLERLMSQAFALGWGRKIGTIRLCLTVLNAPAIKLASDLPAPVIKAFLEEFNGRVAPAPVLSGLLRLLSAVRDVGYSLCRHVLRMVRLAKLMALPPKPAEAPAYIAWLGALPAEVANSGPDKLSLIEFLDEARSGTGVEQVVVQGAKPTELPAGLLHRAQVPPLRYRPSWAALASALLDQARQVLSQLIGVSDFRRRALINSLIIDLPGIRLWFTSDRPAAVLYSNAMIGSEPPVALLRPRFSVPSMMVFYSANVSYAHPPARFAGPVTRLEPEIRFIAADRITMWSNTMTEAFLSASHPRVRLVETGPVVFARQSGFKPHSRFLTRRDGPIRIGIFDVSVQQPWRRFEMGYGQLIYNPGYAAAFFRDIFEATRSCYGENFVIVRKLKRNLTTIHSEDVDFSRLPAVPIIVHDQAESLWKVLEAVDMVLCMPFTSVAYLADAYGIPAAYYDPSGTVVPSPLGGRAALLSSRVALDAWLAAPTCSAPRNPDELVGPKVLSAAVNPEWNEACPVRDAAPNSCGLSNHRFDSVGSHSLRGGAHA